jgi:hypothetical protein
MYWRMSVQQAQPLIPRWETYHQDVLLNARDSGDEEESASTEGTAESSRLEATVKIVSRLVSDVQFPQPIPKSIRRGEFVPSDPCRPALCIVGLPYPFLGRMSMSSRSFSLLSAWAALPLLILPPSWRIGVSERDDTYRRAN